MSRPARNWSFFAFLAMTLVGVGLLAMSWVGGPQPSKFELPPPAPPAWTKAAPSKGQFLSAIEREPARAVDHQPWSAAAVKTLDSLPGVQRIRGKLSLNRVLINGLEYDSAHQLIAERSDNGWYIRLEVQRAGDEPFVLEASIAGLKPEGVRMVSAGGEVLSDFGDLEDLTTIPVGIGDLQMADLAGGLRGVLAGRLAPLGVTQGDHAAELAVWDLPFGVPRRDGDKDLPGGFGTSALVYVETGTPRIRRIRIFDREDRLVRTYGDFDWRSDEAWPPLQSFRVTSRPASSYSVFRIEPIDLERL